MFWHAHTGHDLSSRWSSGLLWGAVQVSVGSILGCWKVAELQHLGGLGSASLDLSEAVELLSWAIHLAIHHIGKPAEVLQFPLVVLASMWVSGTLILV